MEETKESRWVDTFSGSRLGLKSGPSSGDTSMSKREMSSSSTSAEDVDRVAIELTFVDDDKEVLVVSLALEGFEEAVSLLSGAISSKNWRSLNGAFIGMRGVFVVVVVVVEVDVDVDVDSVEEADNLFTVEDDMLDVELVVTDDLVVVDFLSVSLDVVELPLSIANHVKS